MSSRGLITNEAMLAEALSLLLQQGSSLIDHLLAVGGPPPLRLQTAGLEGLLNIIISQQVSVASANAIFGRLKTNFPIMTPEVFRSIEDDILRRCGLSKGKILTLRRIVQAMDEGLLDLHAFHTMTPDQAAAQLTAIKGIGPWTADLYLMFCLGQADIWPVGDLALQEAARLAMGLAERPTQSAMKAIGEPWRPFRSVAARLLWQYYRVVKGRSGVTLV